MEDKNSSKSETAKREEEVLAFWNKDKIFKKSEEKDSPKGEFVFYDGPPFATGLPHYGHILAGTIKDAIPRYKTMCGFRVRRRWGWDCHGLPLEAEIENELGITTKSDIEKLGVGKFNTAARNAVMRFADDWKRIVPRLGRFVDMDRDYKTMDPNYTESVWWIFKSLYEKGLIYKGHKVLHLSPLLGTELSNFEVSQNYQDIDDLAVTVKLELMDERGTFLLVWTTTAWTLPGNMAAAVHRDVDYVKIQVGDERYVLAKKRLDIVRDHYKVVEEFKGEDLIGKSYVPPFNYFKNENIEGKENSWKVWHAPYVSTEEGTGIVHLAPAYGAEDMELAKENGIPIIHHVKKDGTFIDVVRDFRGMQAKPKGDHQRTDTLIAENLKARGLLFKRDTINHSYPHCWRTDAPLLNYAMESWFVKVTDFKDKLVSENKKVHWVPGYIGEKRFGNWLSSAIDWSISRSRFWGAPLPVWVNESNEELLVIGSVEEVKNHVRKSGNTYFAMRHGEAESNINGILNSDLNKKNGLTNKGEVQVEDAASKLRGIGIELVLHSPMQRTTETAKKVAKTLGLPASKVIKDKRLAEIAFGEFEGRSIGEYHSYFEYTHERLTKVPNGGEGWQDVKKRMTELLYELEDKYENKKILIISHNGPLQMIQAGANGCDDRRTTKHIEENDFDLENGEVRKLDFSPVPHNENYELDLHRPYIDDIELVDSDGNKLKRIPDVFDCWFESGSMPYGQFHYPFENTDVFEPKSGFFKRSRGYPADFIAEGMDQTRGWFYSLIVLGVGLFNVSPYKNVIVNGLVLGEDGRKMSKRLKNYPDPLYIVDRYGADALRYYLLSSSIIRGEDLNFSEKGVDEILKKVILRLSNVYSFYELYKDETHKAHAKSSHVLDQWIIARLDQTISQITDGYEKYELDRATRPITEFIDDLSTWYLRRSRDRFKGEDKLDKEAALSTTKYVLIELTKVMAPSMPFTSEWLYQKLSDGSVHLTSWPEARKFNEEAVAKMEKVRNIVSLALEARSAAGIKVRQPLSELKVKSTSLLDEGYGTLIKDEVNVKEVKSVDIEEEVELDTTITEELRHEGIVREFIRYVQDLRKKGGLSPLEKVGLVIETDDDFRALLTKAKDEIKQTALLSDLIFADTDGTEIKVEEHSATVRIKK